MLINGISPWHEDNRRQGTEIQLDNARLLELNRTYRIEDQENPGGALIAEIFTRSLPVNQQGTVQCPDI